MTDSLYLSNNKEKHRLDDVSGKFICTSNKDCLTGLRSKITENNG